MSVERTISLLRMEQKQRLPYRRTPKSYFEAWGEPFSPFDIPTAKRAGITFDILEKPVRETDTHQFFQLYFGFFAIFQNDCIVVPRIDGNPGSEKSVDNEVVHYFPIYFYFFIIGVKSEFGVKIPVSGGYYIQLRPE